MQNVMLSVTTSKTDKVGTSTVTRSTRSRFEESFPKDLPSWLPPLPPSHTYTQTPLTFTPKLSYPEYRRLKAERKRQAELSLIRLKLTSFPKVCLNQKEFKKVVKLAKKKVAQRNQLTATDLLEPISTVETVIQEHLPMQLFLLKPLSTADPHREALLECCVDKRADGVEGKE